MRRASHGFAVLVLLAVLLLIMGTGTPSYSQAEQFPPVVIDVWPQPGVGLLPTDPLTITFDQPMDRPTVEAALTFDPALTGLFTWIDAQTVEFRPGGCWPREQVYAATVETGAAVANGLKLEAPYRFRVQTLGPLAVAQVSPAPDTRDVSLDTRIVVNFNRAVLALGGEEAASDNPAPLSLEPAIAGTGEWVNERCTSSRPPSRCGATRCIPPGLPS